MKTGDGGTRKTSHGFHAQPPAPQPDVGDVDGDHHHHHHHGEEVGDEDQGEVYDGDNEGGGKDDKVAK